jgi:hypothetical protein
LDGVVSGQDDWPVVVVELVGKVVRAGEPVVLRPVVPVVLVGGGRVASEPPVQGDVSGKSVVIAEQDGLAISHLQQLGRECAIVGPKRQRILVWEVGMKARMKWLRAIDTRIQT